MTTINDTHDMATRYITKFIKVLSATQKYPKNDCYFSTLVNVNDIELITTEYKNIHDNNLVSVIHLNTNQESRIIYVLESVDEIAKKINQTQFQIVA